MKTITHARDIIARAKSTLNCDSDVAFADLLGVSKSTLSNWKKRNSIDYELLFSKCEQVDFNWLLTGEGEMLHKTSVSFENSIQEQTPSVTDLSSHFDKMQDNQRIPLYDIDATAGLIGIFNDGDNIPLDYIMIPNISKVDGAVNVKGDSMYPILKSGDIILVQQKHNFEYISYGDIYLLAFSFDDEEYICVKYIQKSESEGKLKLVSHNKNHQDQEIPISCVRALALVKASIRYNTMG